MFGHNSPTDRARKLIEPSNGANSLLVSLKKILGNFVSKNFVVAARGHGAVMLMISGPEKKIQVAFLILFFIQNKKQGKIRVI